MGPIGCPVKRQYPTTNLRCVTSQKSEGLIYIAAEVVVLERYITSYFECLTNTKAWPQKNKIKKRKKDTTLLSSV
jgi:hypothetical protein